MTSRSVHRSTATGHRGPYNKGLQNSSNCLTLYNYSYEFEPGIFSMRTRLTLSHLSKCVFNTCLSDTDYFNHVVATPTYPSVCLVTPFCRTSMCAGNCHFAAESLHQLFLAFLFFSFLKDSKSSTIL